MIGNPTFNSPQPTSREAHLSIFSRREVRSCRIRVKLSSRELNYQETLLSGMNSSPSWEALRAKKLVNHTMVEIEIADIFKYLPGALCDAQQHIKETVLRFCRSTLRQPTPPLPNRRRGWNWQERPLSHYASAGRWLRIRALSSMVKSRPSQPYEMPGRPKAIAAGFCPISRKFLRQSLRLINKGQESTLS